ncbi:MAG: terminase small subunit, partial [Leuconostoc mesenteroides]
NDNIATAKDVEEFLSLAMNDEIEEEQVLMSPNGEVCRVVKKLSGKDRIKAAELMGKRHALFTDKQDITLEQVPVFEDDIGASP